MKIRLLLLLTSTFILTACLKGDHLEVSNVYLTDAQGNPMGTSPDDSQWQNQEFSVTEMALFSDLDTATLSGTIMPAVSRYHYAYPNPFNNYTTIQASISQPIDGSVVIKYVIMDNRMKVVQKAAERVAINNNINFKIPPTMSNGNYRVYFTYNAQGHEHFFKSWGNIRKM